MSRSAARTLRRVAFALLVVAAALGARVAAAMTVLPLDLPALTAGAGTIFVGRVTRVDPGIDERGIAAVWTTFEIEQSLKGVAAPTITLKQIGTSLGSGAFPTVPRFVPGESVFLFVHPASVLGFTSPVGLGQGAFRITERAGERVVANDVANRNLALAAPAGARRAAAAEPTEIPLDTLIARVRALVDATP